jgi:predicted membrane-bound spermidine synthase
MTTDPATTQTLYNQLLGLSREAFAAGLYNAAYHALAAAMHCARVLPDDDALEAVAALAQQQLAAIDQHAPNYEHSSAAAAQRGHDNIFALLARQCHTLLEMRHTDRKRAEWEKLTRQD